MSLVFPKSDFYSGSTVYDSVADKVFVIATLNTGLDAGRPGVAGIAATPLPLCPPQVLLSVQWNRALHTGFFSNGIAWVNFGSRETDAIVFKHSRTQQQVFQLGFTGTRLVESNGIWSLQMYNVNKQDIFGQVHLIIIQGPKAQLIDNIESIVAILSPFRLKLQASYIGNLKNF